MRGINASVPSSLHLIGGGARAVRTIEAYGIREAQRIPAIKIFFFIRIADAGHHVKTAPVEENIDHQTGAGRTFHSSNAFEPCMSGLSLPRLIRDSAAPAFDGDESSEDRIPAGLYP